MHGRSYWNGFVGCLWQHLAETGTTSKERTQLSCLVLSHCLAHCGQGNACSPNLSRPLGLAAGIWPGVLGHSATSSHYLCRTWVLLCQQNTSVARVHQFPDVFFSEFFFFFFCGVAFLCVEQSSVTTLFIKCQPFVTLKVWWLIPLHWQVPVQSYLVYVAQCLGVYSKLYTLKVHWTIISCWNVGKW